MKKIISIFLIFTMCMSFVACANTGDTKSDLSDESSSSVSSEESSEESSQNSSEDSSSSEESKDESQDASSTDDSSEEDEELPVVEGSDEFLELFNANSIDELYLDTMMASSSVTEMVKVASTATSSWDREISYIYNKLIDVLEDEDLKSTIEMEDSAWKNELPIVNQEIKNSTSEDGSMGKVVAAYKIMLVYREYAAKLYLEYFEATGTVDFAPDQSEVVG